MANCMQYYRTITTTTTATTATAAFVSAKLG